MPANKPETHIFSNGLRLVYESHPSKIKQTHIRAFCHVGSIYEPDNIRGASHFIEHMCFKGSRAFPSWSAVNEPFSQSGAILNATTTKQYTFFSVDCLDSDVNPFLKILGDMMLQSKFDRKEYQLELNVVREEMKMRKPDSFIETLAFSGSMYANWVDHDSYHTIGSLPYDDVINYYHQYYVPQNIVLSIVSSISFDTIKRYIQSTPFTQTPKLKITPILNHNTGTLYQNCESNYMLQMTNGDTARIEIGVRVCGQTNYSDYFALNVLRNIVSGSMSSRLFVELREKRGLTYRSGSYINLYETAGVFVLYAISDVSRLIKSGHKYDVTRHKRTQTAKYINRDGKRRKTSRRHPSKPGVIPIMFSILDDLIQNGVKNKELRRAKQSIKDTLKMESIAGGDKSEYNGLRVMLHNEMEIMPNEEIYDKCYKRITKTDINAVIQKYFASRNYYFSAIGGDLPKPHEISKFLKSSLMYEVKGSMTY